MGFVVFVQSNFEGWQQVPEIKLKKFWTFRSLWAISRPFRSMFAICQPVLIFGHLHIFNTSFHDFVACLPFFCTSEGQLSPACTPSQLSRPLASNCPPFASMKLPAEHDRPRTAVFHVRCQLANKTDDCDDDEQMGERADKAYNKEVIWEQRAKRKGNFSISPWPLSSLRDANPWWKCRIQRGTHPSTGWKSYLWNFVVVCVIRENLSLFMITRDKSRFWEKDKFVPVRDYSW